MTSKKNKNDRLYCAVCQQNWDEKKLRGVYQKQLVAEKICPHCGGLLRRENDHPTGEFPAVGHGSWRY